MIYIAQLEYQGANKLRLSL